MRIFFHKNLLFCISRLAGYKPRGHYLTWLHCIDSVALPLRGSWISVGSTSGTSADAPVPKVIHNAPRRGATVHYKWFACYKS